MCGCLDGVACHLETHVLVHVFTLFHGGVCRGARGMLLIIMMMNGRRGKMSNFVSTSRVYGRRRDWFSKYL